MYHSSDVLEAGPNRECTVGVSTNAPLSPLDVVRVCTIIQFEYMMSMAAVAVRNMRKKHQIHQEQRHSILAKAVITTPNVQGFEAASISSIDETVEVLA